MPAIVKNEDLRKEFGARLKALRKQRAWTQKELAAKLDVQFQQLNKYESGVHIPAVEKLVELAEIFETTVDYLLTGDQTDARPLHNLRLLERFRKLETLIAEDQDTVIKLIDAVVAKREMEAVLAKSEESSRRATKSRARR